MKKSILLIIILVFSLILVYSNKAVKTIPNIIVEDYNKTNTISMITAGDVLLHTSVYLDAKTSSDTYDFTSMFEYIKPLVSEYDLAFVNQESIIGGKALGLSSYPSFNSPDEIGDALIDTGFNIINLANNHTLDKGEKGILYSTNYWSKKDVYAVGSYSSKESRDKIVIYEKEGITFAVLSYTTLTNGLKVPSGKDYLVNIYSDEKAKEDIEKVRDLVDVVIVSMHWGTEYTSTPIDSQVEIATYLSDLGVNVIVGHHPHVIEPITYINDTLVIYSLGNFLSAQTGEAKLVGMMVSFDINKEEKNDEVNIKISNVTSHMTYTYYNSKTIPFSNYKIIPFTNLNNDLLSNYESIYSKYNSIINMYSDNIINS